MSKVSALNLYSTADSNDGYKISQSGTTYWLTQTDKPVYFTKDIHTNSVTGGLSALALDNKSRIDTIVASADVNFDTFKEVSDYLATNVDASTLSQVTTLQGQVSTLQSQVADLISVVETLTGHDFSA